MATLKIINNAEITVDGETVAIKQGSAGSSAKSAFEITVSGQVIWGKNTLDTASIRVIYDDDSFVPNTPDFLIFWADQNCYLQFVGSSTNFTQPVLAETPIVLHSGTRGTAPTTGIGFATAANTTDITGGTEPTMEDIDHIVLGNYSGSTLNYKWFAVG